VTDTGPGIPVEKMSRLFQPFDRLGAEQSGIEGSGLGLALTRNLVELMGGTLNVTSVAGQGSCFWVELPQADDPQAQAGEDGGVPAGPTAVPGERTVLYVEDNLDNLRLVQRILAQRPGVRLVSARQGSLGLELAREHRPDLIFLDVHLPDVNGAQVLQELQADPKTRRIPVVVLSADATARQVERLRAAGAQEYLTKPLNVRRFLALVDDVLTGAAASRPVTESAAAAEDGATVCDDVGRRPAAPRRPDENP
jgi:CheY-like chemotaxis protein